MSRERALAALTAVLVSEEIPALLAGLRDAHKAAQAELPALEQRVQGAAEGLAGQQQQVAELAEEIPAGAPTDRREHYAAAAALKEDESLHVVGGRGSPCAGQARRRALGLCFCLSRRSPPSRRCRSRTRQCWRPSVVSD